MTHWRSSENVYTHEEIHMTKNDPASAWRSFFEDLISSHDNKELTSFFRFIQSKLHQFRLSKHYKAREILTETYLRGIKVYQKGDEIKNKSAWIRSTAYNVIRELRRDLDKHRHDDLDEISMPQAIAYLSSQHDSSSEDQPDEDTLSAMKLAFSDLSLEDRALLSLKVLQELSWKEVRNQLNRCWSKVPTEGALRQRKRRALQRLAEHYTHHLTQTGSDRETEE